MRQVNFNTETVYKTTITILDEDGGEVKNNGLFIDIIDDIGFVMDFETTYEINYKGGSYTVTVEKVREETVYIDFEVY